MLPQRYFAYGGALSFARTNASQQWRYQGTTLHALSVEVLAFCWYTLVGAWATAASVTKDSSRDEVLLVFYSPPGCNSLLTTTVEPKIFA